MIRLNGQYVAEKIAKDTYRIDESGVANCYLLIGKEKALLIDTGCGAGNLKEAVRKLTKKPIIVAVTHRHPDHAGGAWQFGTCYVHEADNRTLYGFMSMPMISKRMLKILGATIDGNLKRKRYKILTMQDGHKFELGNRTIEVQAVPGHTKGSVIFLDKEARLMFTGDNTNYCLWMHLPGSTSLEKWMKGARTVLSYYDLGFTAYGGHSKGKQSKEETQKVYDLVKTIVDKNKSMQDKIIDNRMPVILYKRHRICEKIAKE